MAAAARHHLPTVVSSEILQEELGHAQVVPERRGGGGVREAAGGPVARQDHARPPRPGAPAQVLLLEVRVEQGAAALQG